MRPLALLLPLLLLGSKRPPACPDDMVRVPGTQSCIDRYEWPNRAGEKPGVGFSATPSIFDQRAGLVMDAEALCQSVGKQLCGSEEWTSACRGPGGSDYPFGSKLPKRRPEPDKAPCNYAQWFKEPNYDKVFERDPDELARLYQADRSGTRKSCVSASGAADMMGNVEEWTRCPSWTSKGGANCIGSGDDRQCYCLMGRYWSAPEPCQHLITGHAPTYHDYETGFRCCLDLEGARSGS